MEIKKYFDRKEILKTENLIFAIVWALISTFLGTYIIEGIELLQKLADWMLVAIKWIILFPAELPSRIAFISQNRWIILIIALAITIIATPLVRKIYDFLKSMLKRMPWVS